MEMYGKMVNDNNRSDMDNSVDRDNSIITLKSQIFDLQIAYGKIRQAIEDKLKELNELNKNSGGK